MKIYIIISALVYIIGCEWVEITPIKNREYVSGSKYGLTTTESYESVMKKPLTTPAFLLYNNITPITESDFDISNEDATVQTPSFTKSTEFPNLHDNSLDEKNVSVDEFIPFLKTTQKNLLNFKNSHKSKMFALKHLRDHLLNNIKDLSIKLWKPKRGFEARGYHDEDDSHMDFPSNEGALMTIGFLTFAVFLIKLIIKLVHALKSKQQYNNMSTTTTAASVVFLKRRKRDEEQEEINKILQYINEFKMP